MSERFDRGDGARMGRLTQAEAKMRAAQVALEAIAIGRRARQWTQSNEADQVEAELDKLETMLRRLAIGSDKILGRQMSRELGRQVKPSRGMAAQVEALAKKAGEK